MLTRHSFLGFLVDVLVFGYAVLVVLFSVWVLVGFGLGAMRLLDFVAFL